jgi:hypothetical protein
MSSMFISASEATARPRRGPQGPPHRLRGQAWRSPRPLPRNGPSPSPVVAAALTASDARASSPGGGSSATRAGTLRCQKAWSRSGDLAQRIHASAPWAGLHAACRGAARPWPDCHTAGPAPRVQRGDPVGRKALACSVLRHHRAWTARSTASTTAEGRPTDWPPRSGTSAPAMRRG